MNKIANYLFLNSSFGIFYVAFLEYRIIKCEECSIFPQTNYLIQDYECART